MKTVKSIVTASVMLAAMQVCGVAANEMNKSYKVEPQFIMGYAFGGDDMGTLKYEDGSDSDVTSGGGYTLGAGLKVSFDAKPYGVKTSVNYHGDSATAENADITFDRFEFSVMPYYQLNENVNVAVGVSYHTGVEYEVDFEGTENFEFDAAIAWMAEFEYMSSRNLAFSLRGTVVDYEVAEHNDRSVSSTENVSGNNLGIFMTYSFGQ